LDIPISPRGTNFIVQNIPLSLLTQDTLFLECDMSSSPRDIDLEEIWTYDSAPMTHDFIPTTTDARHVETAHLAENNDPLAENFGAEPAINENGRTPLENEQVGFRGK
jgi:hypothetical protein